MICTIRERASRKIHRNLWIWPHLTGRFVSSSQLPGKLSVWFLRRKKINHFDFNDLQLVRSHENPTQKLDFQKKLKQKLLAYGYDNVAEQVFRVRYLENKNEKDELQYELGKNVIATLPGKYSEGSKHVQRMLLKKIINLRTNKINKKVRRGG